MKRLSILALAAAAAAIAWFQAASTPRPLAQLVPGGALVYLEAQDLSRLLSDWDSSSVKRDWLRSADYDQFQRSNLFLKLNIFYKAYSAAAGFLPDMTSLRSLAGDQSALALYDLRNVEFAYITRISESKAAQSRLWLARGSFETRQASGVTFYLKTSGDVELAFAATNGYLLVTSGEERMAGMLGLLAGSTTPAIASEIWYKNPTTAAGAPGELRLVMNLESLVGNTYFRSYWIQRNASDVRRFVSGVADIHRTTSEIREQRIFLKRPGLLEELPPPDAMQAAATLAQMAPDDAGLYRVWAAPQIGDAAALVETHILNPRPAIENRPIDAPPEDQTGVPAVEADLETRIDEPPLLEIGDSDSAAFRTLIADNGAQAMLQVESSQPRAASPFIAMPCAIALMGHSPWNADRVKNSLGGNWTTETHGTHTLYRAGSLAKTAFVAEGPLLIVANDAGLLVSLLDHRGAATPLNAVYTASFRHDRERANFARMMTGLDFAQNPGVQEPPFFSGNLASLSNALRPIAGFQIVEQTTSDRVEQRITYRLAP